MSTKIRIKHSATANDAPTAAQIPDAGELAINTHEDTLRLFARDSGGNVRVIGGSGSGNTGALGYWTRTGVNLSPVNGNGDGVRIGGSNIQLNGNGSSSFSGVATFNTGLRVKGGVPGNIDDGLLKTSNDNLGLRVNSGYALVGNTNQELALCGSQPIANQKVRLSIPLGAGTQIGYYNSVEVGPDTTDAQYFRTSLQSQSNSGTGYTVPTVTLFRSDEDSSSVNSDLTITELSGYYASIGNRSNYTNPYNFLAVGQAPNFFAGNTYIGGTRTRNTRELWESTLTEEQKEELTAGTLTIPANVSTPGDGSFVRQWWYNQQSAEDQALIDAGELDYPKHLQAANFTDTFDLGDNTAINLKSSGIIETGGYSFNANKTSKNVVSRGFVYSPNRNALLTTNRPDNVDDNVDVFLARVDNVKYDASGNRVPVNITQSTSFKSEGPLGNSAQEYGVYDSYIGFSALNNGQATNAAIWTGEANSYGFFSQLNETLASRNYVTVTNGGNVSATDGKYTDVATTATSGSGDSLTVDIWVESSRVVAAAINTEGTGYVSGDTVSVDGYSGVELTYKTPGTASRYNFYADGTAPNFFAGNAIFGADPVAPVGTQVGLKIVGGNNPRIYCVNTTAANSSIFACDDNSGGPVMQFRISDGSGGITECGNITVTTAGGVNFVDNSDYRLKSNIQPLSSAVDSIKALKPCTYTRNGVDGVVGFIAHEVQEVAPQAAHGIKDATEAIGTHTDAEGVVTTDVPEPEATSYGETWVQTGTRPVYQGVDQTKLIPLLTKALQECLERIEVLEAANSTAR